MNSKSVFLFLSLLGTFSEPLHASSYWDKIKLYPSLAFAAVSAAMVGVLWATRPDRTMPTQEQLNIVSFVPQRKAKAHEKNTTKENALAVLKRKRFWENIVINGTVYRVQHGIPDCIKDNNAPITLYSGGYSNDGRPYAYCGFTAIKSGLVPGACITFDFPTDTRKAFNFCQEQDIQCVKTAIRAVLAKNKDASIILHGACKGATNNLRFLAEQSEAGDAEEYLKHIKGVVAESPPVSVKKALSKQPLSAVTLALMRPIFPNYNPNAKTILQAQRFPECPTLIAGLPEDTISAHEDVKAITERLNGDCKARVELFMSRQAHIRHGQIGKAHDYRHKVATFMDAHGLKFNMPAQ